MRHSSPFGRISKGHVSARLGRVGDWRTAARPKAIPQSQNSRCRCRPFCRPERPSRRSPRLRPLRNTHTATVTGGPPGIPGRYERAIMLPLGALLATGLRGCGWTRRGGHRAPEPSHDRRRRPPSPLRTARASERDHQPGPARGRLPGMDAGQVQEPGRPPRSSRRPDSRQAGAF